VERPIDIIDDKGLAKVDDGAKSASCLSLLKQMRYLSLVDM